MVVTVVFFAAIEAIMAIAGITREVDSSDPYAGFSSHVPLFKTVEHGGGPPQLITANNKRHWFNDQRFAAIKAEGTRRVFCVGGSTTYGRPFHDPTSFCGWLRELLPEADSSCQWEVINAGGISYASYRVLSVMKELSAYQPDVFVVYCGHNEFLESRTYANIIEQSQWSRDVATLLSYTRTWSAVRRGLRSGRPQKPATAGEISEEVNEILNHTVGPTDYHRDDEWRDQVVRHFRANLNKMISVAQEAGASIIFVVPAANEKDCSPFKSELVRSLSDKNTKFFEQKLADAVEELVQDPAGAQQHLRQAKELDDRFAEVDYLLGRIEFKNGNFKQAAALFQKSIDEDVCTLRAPSEMVAAVRDLQSERDICVVDYPKLLKEDCSQKHGHRILGNEYFLDHVHPSVDAHGLLARWIVSSAQSAGIVSGNVIDDEKFERTIQKVSSRLDATTECLGYRNLAKVLHWAGKFDEAIPNAERCLQITPGDAEVRLVLADSLCQTNRIDESTDQYEALLNQSPGYVRAYLPYGELLYARRDFERARDHLLVASFSLSANSPELERAFALLGATHLELGEFKAAVSALESLYRSDPYNEETTYNLAQAHIGLGNTVRAIELYQQLVEISPENIKHLDRLGILLLKQKQPREALECFESILKSQPDHDGALLRKNIALQLMTDSP